MKISEENKKEAERLYQLAVNAVKEDAIKDIEDSLQTKDDDLLFFLYVLSDIRQKSGVGDKPMLSELADAICEKLNRKPKEGF